MRKIILWSALLLSACASNSNIKQNDFAPITDAAVKGNAEALATLQSQAQAGNVDAQMGLVNYYFSQKEPELFAAWLRQAAKKGQADAQAILAMYYSDLAPREERNMDLSQDWAQKLSEQGNVFGKVFWGLSLAKKEGATSSEKKQAKEALQYACRHAAEMDAFCERNRAFCTRLDGLTVEMKEQSCRVSQEL